MQWFESLMFAIGTPLLAISLIVLGVSNYSEDLAYRGALIGFVLIIASVGLRTLSRTTDEARTRYATEESSNNNRR